MAKIDRNTLWSKQKFIVFTFYANCSDVVTSCIKHIIVHSCEAQKLIMGTKELLGDQINRIALIAGLHLKRDCSVRRFLVLFT